MAKRSRRHSVLLHQQGDRQAHPGNGVFRDQRLGRRGPTKGHEKAACSSARRPTISLDNVQAWIFQRCLYNPHHCRDSICHFLRIQVKAAGKNLWNFKKISSYRQFFFSHIAERNDWRVVTRLYRGPLLVIVFIFLLGINVYGWRSSGVNHVLIFELDPRNHLSEQHLMELAAILGVIWTLSVLMFLYSDHMAIPAYINPLALIILMSIFILNPTRTLQSDARFWLLRVVGRIFSAPFFYVGFADFWVADQLNSLATAFTDFHYLVCFYTSSNATVNSKYFNL